MILFSGITVFAEDNDSVDYPITLTQSYTYGKQELTLNWSGVSDTTTISDVAKTGDYVLYESGKETIKTRVVSNEDGIVKLISVDSIRECRNRKK